MSKPQTVSVQVDELRRLLYIAETCMEQVSDEHSDRRVEEELQKMIASSRSEADQRWILVKERLPETNDNVLAYSIRSKTTHFLFWLDGLWYSAYDPAGGTFGSISHWMPLPPSPFDTEGSK